MSDKIAWKYPISAVTESISNSVDYKIWTQCHKKNENDIELYLPGVTNINPQEEFEIKVTVNNKDINKIIHKWISIDPKVDKISGPDDKLKYILRFNPHKPFKSSGEIIIFKPSGGRWRFKSTFESTAPDIDQEIKITSSLNVTSHVSFDLNFNVLGSKSAKDFKAEFTHDSASEFAVTPKAGIADSGNKKTTFTISYTPIEYGKVKIGKLIIQTHEYYWNFLVKGTFPKYKVPEKIESQIDNKLDPKLKSRLKSVNKSKLSKQ